MRWRRIDVPGSETSTVERLPDCFRLTGELHVVEEGVPTHLRYEIVCDRAWRTQSALVEGTVATRRVRLAIASDGNGHWTLDGRALPQLEGAQDVDLGFTPMTNTLPIRRLDLAIGERETVRSAWLRFPELRLEPLEQTYAREGERLFRYEADVDGEPFTAQLETDQYGRVLEYEGLWTAESQGSVRGLVT
jgi:hypothetical protein